jgi:hypothetical protein
MNKHDAIQHFGGAPKLAAALCITVEAVSQWDEIPEGRQWQLYAITAGQLMPDEQLVTKTPELLRPNIKPAA